LTALLLPGTEIRLGDRTWQVHAAPGHDTHSVILFEPAARILVSADALWERGFGVVFPELEGDDAFDELGETLDLIEALAPAIVIPGHGKVFTDVGAALAFARERLKGFIQQPGAPHPACRQGAAEVQAAGVATPAAGRLSGLGAGHAVFPVDGPAAFFLTPGPVPWIEALVAELVRSGAAAIDDGVIRNAG
jgi:glyoxylase-like metal-dependent hydrolase (beta-lactamase superfamily II)